MKLITRNTDYALRALCYISKSKELVSVDELVDKLGVPRQFMRKILQRLNKERILASYKGRGGGFKLKVNSEKIFILEIMRIFQGQVGLNGCFLKKDICPDKGRCVLRKKIHAIEDDLFKRIKQINVASLI